MKYVPNVSIHIPHFLYSDFFFSHLLLSSFYDYIFHIMRPFTLIELLMVIAVIAILMCIMLPALKVARDMAYSVPCKGNIRQIGQVWMMYSNDNNDYLCLLDQKTQMGSPSPYIYQDGNREYGWQWTLYIFRDVINDRLLRDGNNPANPMTRGLAYIVKILRCPAMSAKYFSKSLKYETGVYGHSTDTAYGMTLRSIGGVDSNKIRKMSSIPSPSKKSAFIESKASHAPSFGWYTVERVGHVQGIVAFDRHGRPANVVYCDGHVESKGKEIITDAYRYNVSNNSGTVLGNQFWGVQ